MYFQSHRVEGSLPFKSHVQCETAEYEARRRTVSHEKGSKMRRIAFTSGEIVPASGIWRSNHEGCEASCEVWLPKQGYFPPCPGCSATAYFTVVEEVQHILEDPDFQ